MRSICAMCGAVLAACTPDLESSREYCAPMTAPSGLDYHSHPDADRFQALLDDAVASTLPGAAMLIENRAGLWIGASGQCDLDRDLPMQPFTRSRIASVTKPFVAATTLRLAEEQRLGLDDVIADHLPPRVARKVTNSDEITIRQLLNHTSGLPDEPMTVSATTALDVFAENPFRAMSRDEYLSALYGQPARFPPGQDWAYSNFGYALLGLVFEEVTGEDEWSVVRSRVIEPLGLTDTFYDPDVQTPPGLARGYADLYGDAGLTDTSDWDALHPLNAEGGIVSTVYDLGRFMTALLEGDLLTPASRAEMLTCVEAAPDDGLDGYGLGLGCTTIDDKPTYFHQGLVIGYIAGLYAYPEQGATVALLVNGSFGELQEEIAELLEERIPPLLEDLEPGAFTE